MKKMILLTLAAALSFGAASAQKPAKKKSVVKTVFLAEIECAHCVNKIMNNVPSLGRGIKDVDVDLKNKEITVVYDASKNDAEHIIDGLASLKVKAEVKKPVEKTAAEKKSAEKQDSKK